MDPNATLHLLREAVREARVDIRTQGYVNLGDVEVVLDLTEALDGWLTGGGFLPDAWRPEESRTQERTYDLVTGPGWVDPNDVPGWEG